MKRIMIALAAAAMLAGCAKKEAELFGYKGADLTDDDNMYFTTGPGVTNWVPARVLSVVEEYPMSAEEKALIAAAGIITPSETFKKIPEGYAKSATEPWFETWTKESEQFGHKGVNGFIAHFDADREVWETSETYFSCYHADEASALAALSEIRALVAQLFSPKKFYDFDHCWVAEYLRLRVMCLVGQKADGTWSCMLDIQDKNLPGCGQWEPIPAQEERLAEYNYRKAFLAWKEAKSKVLAGNHEAVEKIRRERALALFGDDVHGYESDDGRMAYQRGGMIATNTPCATVAERKAIWSERVKELATATGVTIEAEPTVQDLPSGFVVWGATGSGDIYDIRLDIAFPPAEKPEAEKSEGEEGEAPEDAEPPCGEWRELCYEKLQDGFVVPARPQPPKF